MPKSNQQTTGSQAVARTSVGRNAEASEVPSKKRAGDTSVIIFKSLREDILSGKIPPGGQLLQASVARDFGTSRGPVREALQRLQQEQLVIAKANQKYSVAPFDIADYESLLSLKLLNMTVAIRVCVPLLDDAQIQILRQCVEQMNASLEHAPEEWETAYRTFSRTIVAPAGERIGSLISSFIDNLQRYRAHAIARFPSVIRIDGSELSHVLAAVKARDAELASRHYANYFCRLAMLILAGVAPRYEPSILRATACALLGDDDQSQSI
ncbi:GntR family transcriptional regulator [Paraburkholderia sediminicola]|uniref:GntR family transcriptional regulator n=1 Tax=Paraburkholderia metrosideri TaxID=580937 RepID=A0ABW9DXW4_9BURK